MKACSTRFVRLGLLSVVAVFVSMIAIPVMTADAGSTPGTVLLQGRMTDSNGDPVDLTDVTVVVKYYDAVTAGNTLATETLSNQDVTEGLYNLSLGSGSYSGTYGSLAAIIEAEDAVWFTVNVDSEGETSPRVKLQAVPYALNAELVDGKEGSELIDTSATGQTKSGGLTVQSEFVVDVAGGGGTGGNVKINASGVADRGQIDTDSSGIWLSIGGSPQAFLGSAIFRPQSDDTARLGASTLRWSETYSVEFYSSDGAAGTPSFTFIDDTNSGLYRIGADHFAAVAGGTQVANFKSTGFSVNEGGSGTVDFRVESATNARAIVVDASSDRVGLMMGGSLPSFGIEFGERTYGANDGYGFSQDGDTYLSRTGADELSVTTGGSQRMKISSSGVEVDSLVVNEQSSNPHSATAGKGSLWVTDATEQSLVFENDNGTDHVVAGPASDSQSIATGTFTLSSNLPQYARVVVGPETGTADDLDSINGGRDGQIVVLEVASGDTVTAKDATGNLKLGSSSDQAVSVEDRLVLQYDGSNWHQLSFSDN